jgi:hypothetical protein
MPILEVVARQLLGVFQNMTFIDEALLLRGDVRDRMDTLFELLHCTVELHIVNLKVSANTFDVDSHKNRWCVVSHSDYSLQGYFASIGL